MSAAQPSPGAARRARGRTAYHGGLAAEEIVARTYARRGLHTAERRWRGAGGEIDLILQDGDGIVFVEVKQATTHEIAATRLSSRQLARIRLSAEEYLARLPRGALTDCRVDLALVDSQGRVEIISNVTQ